MSCLSSTICVQCESGYFGSSCTACHNSCLECSNANSCTKCPVGSYIGQTGVCIKCAGWPICLQCNLNNVCIRCADGYFVNTLRNNVCERVVSNSLVDKCVAYSAQQICAECVSGFFLTK